MAIAGLPTASMTMLRRAGIVELMGEQAFYWSVERALLDPRPRPENAQTVQRVYKHKPPAGL